VVDRRFKDDPAAEFLKDHGESFEHGGKMKAKQNATDLADSGVRIDGRSSKKNKGGINLRKVAEVLEAEGLDPTVEIVRVVQGDLLEADVKARVLLELLGYCQPKLKAVEHTGPNGGPIQQSMSFEVMGVRPER